MITMHPWFAELIAPVPADEDDARARRARSRRRAARKLTLVRGKTT
ncbi:MAG: hypothetical protein HOY71_34570 [Nonomuraea sp.]|nr:hypothetical protein [Nonomuraea sp.]